MKATVTIRIRQSDQQYVCVQRKSKRILVEKHGHAQCSTRVNDIDGVEGVECIQYGLANSSACSLKEVLNLLEKCFIDSAHISRLSHLSTTAATSTIGVGVI